MPPPAKKHFWRRARLIFRWLRITVWLLVLAALCASLWLNRVGLPAFLKQRLQAELRAQGLETEFARLRLRWQHGLVAEGVRLEPADQHPGPRLSARELVLRLDYGALLRRQLKLRGLALSDGRMTIPLRSGQAPAHDLVIEPLEAQLDFLSDDRWQLSTLEGRCLGIDFRLTGAVSNAPALLKRTPVDDATARRRADFWNRLVSQLELIQFTPPAKLKGTFSGDAAQPGLLSARAELAAELMKSPWGGGRDLAISFTVLSRSPALAVLKLKASARHGHTPSVRADGLALTVSAEMPLAQPEFHKVQMGLDADSIHASWGRARKLHLDAEAASLDGPCGASPSRISLSLYSLHTPWGDAAELAGQGRLQANPTNPALAQGECEVRAAQVHGAWMEATNALLVTHTAHSCTSLWPASLSARLALEQPSLKNTNASPAPATTAGRARLLLLDANLTLPPLANLAPGQTNLSWRARLDKIPATVHGELDQLAAGPLEARRISFDAAWRAPLLLLDSFQADLYGGRLTATGRLDAVTRNLVADLAAQVDPGRLVPVLGPDASDWLTAIRWEQPPRAEATLRATLPPWTNLWAGWTRDLLPALTLAGTWQGGQGAARTVSFTSVHGAFALSNLTWQLRDVEVARPEGRVWGDLDTDLRTGHFQARLASTIDPAVLPPLSGSEDLAAALSLFQFTQPPHLQAEAWGRWGDWEQTGLRGRVALTNATFRGEPVKSCVAEVAYTNQAVDIVHGRVEREEGVATVDRVFVDLRAEVVGITNVQSAIEPLAVARAIGPDVVKVLAPYRFTQSPPVVHFEGRVGTRNRSGLDDARFEVSGGPFQWQNFKFTRVAARAHWLRETVALTEFQGTLQGGQVAGEGYFEPGRAGPGTDFHFQLTATNVSAQPLLADLFPANTNRIEGLLSGRLSMTEGSSEDLRHWSGSGDVALHDGLIWDVPVFKLFSPILNKVSPGLGNNRAREAGASFIITNSVIFTRDLAVQASTMRMQFEGGVDFEGEVRGTMEAELFRNMPGFGWMLSRVLWPVTKIFEYKVSGTLSNPRIQPLYLPRILFAPLHPLRTIKELLQEDKDKAAP